MRNSLHSLSHRLHPSPVASGRGSRHPSAWADRRTAGHVASCASPHALLTQWWKGGWCCLLSLLLVLSACGGSRSVATPIQVHAQWVQGVRENDRAAIETVAGVALVPYLDTILSNMQVQLHSPVLGPLQSVDIRAPQDVGAARSGWSIWQFEHTQQCYATTLTAIDEHWKVTDWQRHPCQEMPQP